MNPPSNQGSDKLLFAVFAQCKVRILFILFMGFSRQEYWSGLPFPSPVDHVLSELSIMTRLSWVALHSMAHGFLELDKAVVHVITLTSFLWLWFVCLPSDASRNTYHLTCVSLTLDKGYLFTAAQAKLNRCSWPWTRVISSQPPLLTLNVEYYEKAKW